MNLPTFANRRIRGDLITPYRALHDLLGVNSNVLFEMNSGSRFRGHAHKLPKEKFRTTQGQYFVSNQVFSAWNDLPCKIGNC